MSVDQVDMSACSVSMRVLAQNGEDRVCLMRKGPSLVSTLGVRSGIAREYERVK